MIILSPITTAQEFNIIPRNPDRYQNLDLTITEDGTGQTETFTDITVFENGDFICVSQAFNILREGYTYYISILFEDENWWRGKARCAGTVDNTKKHTLYVGEDTSMSIVDGTEEYKIINNG